MKMPLNSPTHSRTSGINLAGSLSHEFARFRKVEAIIKRTSFVVLGVYLVVLVGVAGINFFFLRQEGSLRKAGESLRGQINTLSPVEILLQTVKNRTSLAANILGTTQTPPERVLAQVVGILPLGATIAEVDAQEGKFSISVSLPNSGSVVEFFKSLSASSQFSNIEMDGLSLSNQGFYTVSLNIR